MRHVIVFCYIFTILIGVSALTIQWLAGKGRREKNFSVMKPFIGMLLFMNLYDFIIYYSDNIMGGPKNNLLLSIGDCFIAVLVLLWLRVIHSFSEEPAPSRSVQFAEKYVINFNYRSIAFGDGIFVLAGALRSGESRIYFSSDIKHWIMAPADVIEKAEISSICIMH